MMSPQMDMFHDTLHFVRILLLAALAAPVVAAAGDVNMSMPMADAPAHFRPTREAYTDNHQFLVKLLAVPSPVPFEEYFTLRFAVYDGHDSTKKLSGAVLKVSAGMRHGMKQGYAHGMESAPKITGKDGVFTVSGMYFHMMGAWTLEASVEEGGKRGIAFFQLPCCGQ